MSWGHNTRGRERKRSAGLFSDGRHGYGDPMESEDGPTPNWIAATRERLPYAIGFFGLLAWFALLYFMLRDVA